MANILIIDDDTDFRTVLKLMLQRMGHTPMIAQRGDEGLALTEKNPFDLVILDLMMPDMDGYEVTRRLRAADRTRNLPILILTARSQPADREGALEAGADAYMTKPVDPRELSSKITEVLNTPRPEARPAETSSTTRATAPTPVASVIPSGQAPSGRVIVLLGLRGGAGKTTLAVNLAGMLTRAGRRVCLLDLSPSVGHVTIHLRVRPQATWADLPAAIDSKVVAQVVTRHESGLFVVAAPAKPARAGLSAEACQTLLHHLRGSFTDVVVDSAPVLDDATCAALSACRYTLLVLSPDIGSVQTAIGTLRTLPTLSVFEEQIKLLLNQPTPEAQVPQVAVEKALGRHVDAAVPYDLAQSAALAQGIPLVLSQFSAPLVNAIASFATAL